MKFRKAFIDKLFGWSEIKESTLSGVRTSIIFLAENSVFFCVVGKMDEK